MANQAEQPVSDTQRLEMVILGGMLAKPDILAFACSGLSEDDFQNPNSRKLFTVADDMWRKDEPVDNVAVIDPCMAAGVESGFAFKCLDLYTDGFFPIDAMQDRISELADLSDCRYAYNALQGVLKDIRERRLLDKTLIAQKLQGLATAITARHKVAGTDYIGEEAKHVLDRRAKARRGRIEFGLKSIDVLMSGMGKGQLVILAARPSVGKSAISLQPAITAARNGNRVKVVTIEMTTDEVTERILSMMSNVPSHAMVGDRPMSQTEGVDLIHAMSELSRLPLSIDDESRKPSQIEQAFLEAKNSGKPIRLMVIDYFGLMRGDSPKMKAFEELSEVSKELKRIAKRYEATILLLSQITREVNQYTRPELGMLRDTGSLEQDADKVVFLWRDKTDNTLVNFSVEKNRQGTTGTGQLKFIGDTMRFEELSSGLMDDMPERE